MHTPKQQPIKYPKNITWAPKKTVFKKYTGGTITFGLKKTK